MGEYRRAIDFYQQRLVIAREIGDRRGESIAILNRGETFIRLERYEEAIEDTQLALEMKRQIGDRAGEAIALKNLAEIAYKTQDLEQAREHCDAALQIATELGIPLVKECEALREKIEAGESLGSELSRVGSELG